MKIRPLNSLRQNAFPVIFLILGLVLAFHPMLLSGFHRMQSDLGDTRFNQYILEHGYRWLIGDPHHASFWDGPFFYPAKNTLAYSDVLLGSAPFYWVWRALGFASDTSIELWMLLISALNFAACFALLRRILKVDALAASLGAFLFAFGAPRVTQIGHQQLLAHFYSVIAILAAHEIFSRPARALGKAKAASLWAVIALCEVAQLYNGFYLGWFLGVTLLFAAGWGLALPSFRSRLLEVLGRDWLALGAGALASGALLLPFARHYLAAAHELGTRPFPIIHGGLPTLQAWLYLGPDSWLYSWMTNVRGFAVLHMEHEKRLGIGIATSIACAVGLYRERHRPVVKVIGLVGLTWLACISVLPVGKFTLWKYLSPLIPASSVIRATSRVVLLLVLGASAGAALLIQRMSDQSKAWKVILLICLVVLEQAETPNSFDRDRNRTDIQAVASRIRPDCPAFLFSALRWRKPELFYKLQLDAMWAGMETGVPTLNGYSGNIPPGWALGDSWINEPAHAVLLERNFRGWVAQAAASGAVIDPSRVCQVQFEPMQ